MDLSIVQGPFSVAPCQTLVSRFATFSSPYRSAPVSAGSSSSALRHCLDHGNAAVIPHSAAMAATSPLRRRHPPACGLSAASERSIATLQAVRGWSRAPCSHFKNPSCAPCSHFKIPSCAGLESAFERAMGKPFQRQRLKSQVRADEGGTQTTRPYEGYVGGGGRWVCGRGERW